MKFSSKDFPVRPSDTPYAGGVYEFDIFFPIKHPGYPSLPPKVENLNISLIKIGFISVLR